MKRSRASYRSVPYYSKRRSTTSFHGKSPLKIGSVQEPGQYAALVVDPWNNPSVAIPDLNSVPVAVFSVEQQFTFDTNASGVGGFVAKVGCGSTSGQFQTESTTTSDALFAYNSAVTYDFVTPISNLYGWYRVVAASVMVEFLGNDTNNQGKISAVSLLGSTGAVFEIAKTNLSLLENARDCYVAPAKDGVVITWRPKQTQDFDQYATSSTYGNNFNNYVAEFQAHLTGCAAGSWQARVKFHCEGIPRGGSATEGVLDPPTEAYCAPDDMAASSGLLAQVPHITSAINAKNGFFTRLASAVGNAVREYTYRTGWNLITQALVSGVSGFAMSKGLSSPPGGE